ncbi:MAG: type II toxin-antitoxin system VapC family toxin [Moraxellaceae bacterium]|nr:type II toxin-antitoxin system VapC family toxin [Moraxellaceae bacterium]
MIGLDTNVLARYYIEDVGDNESIKQREAARRLIEAGSALMVSKTVLLELEWVMRGYYEFSREAIGTVFTHLLAMSHLHFENKVHIQMAVQHYQAGLDFADALHHASYHECTAMASFDDRRFARRVKKLALIPHVIIPK